MSEKEPLDFQNWVNEKHRNEIDEIGREIDRLYKAGIPQYVALERYPNHGPIVQVIYAIGGLPNKGKPPPGAA